MIEQGVHDVYQSDTYKEYLKFMTKFHSYSLNNTMLIFSQYPDASLVAGFNKWKDFDRSINKGEKGIKILAPYEHKFKERIALFDEHGKALLDSNGNQVYEEQEIKQTRFRVVSVFDIKQTSGKPIPQLINDLKGSSESVVALIEAIKIVSEVPILFRNIENDETIRNGAKGYYNHTTNTIVVNEELEPLQIAKTLVHECAHSILHKNTNKSKNQKEIEAESIAFVVCHHFNVDTSDYSFGYIASYAEHDFILLKETLKNIQEEAHKLINILEPEHERMMRTMFNEITYYTPVELEKMSETLIDKLMTKISALPIYDYLRSKDADLETGVTALYLELQALMKDMNIEFPTQCKLYAENPLFRDALFDSIFLRCYYDILVVKQERPFLELSTERMNYNVVYELAKPVLEGEAVYIKMTAPYYDDVNIEIVDENTLAISSFYKLNGDLMHDPSIELTIDHENKLLIPKYYQNDNFQMFVDISYSPEYAAFTNSYIYDWMNSVKENHYKIHEIITDDKTFEFDKCDYQEMKQFCTEQGIEKYLKPIKTKEKER